MKKIDVVMFNDEIDILQARLRYLYEHIDYFVITEFNETFQAQINNLILKIIFPNFKNLRKNHLSKNQVCNN